MEKNEDKKTTKVSKSTVQLLVSLDIVTKIEAKSVKLPSKNDQDIRDIVRLILEKGSDYTDTEFGDITNNLLNSLDRVLTVTETYRSALVDALPHIECSTQDQSNLISHIGEITLVG